MPPRGGNDVDRDGDRPSRVESTAPASRDGHFGAVFAGDVDAVRRLLASRADPNATDTAGRTPLHHAVETGRHDIAAVLLAHGGSHALADREGHCALSRRYVDRRGLRRIRQHYLRTPAPGFDGTSHLDAAGAKALAALQRDGFLRLAAHLHDATLARTGCAGRTNSSRATSWTSGTSRGTVSGTEPVTRAT